MIPLRRNKRVLYVCQMYQDGKLKKYKEPIKLKENWQITNSQADILNLGMDSYQFIRIKTSINHIGYYHLGDRVYIDIEPPIEHDPLCKTANYEVYKDPAKSLNECEIMLKRLSGKGEYGQ